MMGSISEPKVSLNKRLIVCCDGILPSSPKTFHALIKANDSYVGTWEDGNSEEINNPLSNITRIARAIKPHAEIIVNGVRTIIPQITYYQKGVGTGVLDQYLGGTSPAHNNAS